MNKKEVIRQIQLYLEEEIQATTQKVECGSCEKLRLEELHSLKLMYQHLPCRNYSAEDVVCPAALVEVELNELKSWIFITPKGGGLITRVAGQPIQVMTVNSPLGEKLLGKKQNDLVEVELRGECRTYRICSIR